MKSIKTKTVFLYVCLFLVTSISFATGDEEDKPIKPGTETIAEDNCSFFCSIGAFFEDLFN